MKSPSQGETKLKISMLTAMAFVLGTCGIAVGAETGDLKIRFVYEGDAPKREPVRVTADEAFCGKHGLLDETLIVNPENKGIKNVVVAVYTGRGGSKLEGIEPRNQTLTLANQNCRFEPRIVVAQEGDTLKITNPDTVGHNANLGFFENTPVNPLIPPGQEIDVDLEKPEPGLVNVTCNIHPWMKAKLLVLDHPFAAVSDENGEVVIKGIPVGEQVFRANHEAGKIDEVSVDGKDEKWSRSRFTLDIKPGMNDLGTVVIPKDALSN